MNTPKTCLPLAPMLLILVLGMHSTACYNPPENVRIPGIHTELDTSIPHQDVGHDTDDFADAGDPSDTVEPTDTDELDELCGSTVCAPNHICEDNACARMPILALGSSHTCALLPDNQIKCWGSNNMGQLGHKDDTAISMTTPQPVAFPRIPVNLFAGFSHTCALTTENEVWCWGRHHALVDEPIDFYASEPEHVESLELIGHNQISELVLGTGHSCMRGSQGTVQCWGEGYSGQLGNGQSKTSADPVRVSGNLTARQIALGAGFSCALTPSQTVYCWGNNTNGRIGADLDVEEVSSPLKLEGLENVQAISSKFQHTCALLEDKTIRCWGFNSDGQHGNGSQLPAYKPVQPNPRVTDVKQLAVGSAFTCVLLESGQVKCAGFGGNGQLGIGGVPEDYQSLRFELVPELNDVYRLEPGQAHICAIHNDRTVSCWGYNSDGQVGTGTDHERIYSPTKIDLN